MAKTDQLRDLRKTLTFDEFECQFDHPGFAAHISITVPEPTGDGRYLLKAQTYTPTEFVKLAVRQYLASWALPIVDELIADREARAARATKKREA
jgi:hypothetical protein